MKHYIQLVGFDGTNYWRLFYIEVVDGKEIYYGLIHHKGEASFSRHGSVETHIKVGGETISMDKLFPELKSKPLSDLKNMESLGIFNTQPKYKISEEEYRKYVSKKCNGLFLIDLRNFVGAMNFEPAIVNPKYGESIIRKNWYYDSQFYVYTASNPWVVIYIRNPYPKMA